MKIIDLLPQFKRYALAEREIRPRVCNEIIAVILLLEKRFPSRKIKDHTTNDIRTFLYEQKAKKLWASSTFRNKRQYLKSFFDFCKSYGYLQHNPIDPIVKPKLPKRIPRSLDKEEVKLLLLHTDCINWHNKEEGLRNRAIIRTFLFTGIRLTELLQLKYYQVNLEEKQIYVKQGKGRKDRLVPIHRDLLPYLKSYLRSKKASLYAFTSLRSECPLTPKNLYRIIKKIRKESDIYFSPHMLRHTMAKNCIESNINPFVLQAILGHSDISTTQIYVSISQKSIQDQFKNLEF